MKRGTRVFVSGGAGVIGHALVEKLHAAGAILMVGDLRPRPSRWPGEIRYRQGDLNFIEKRELDDFAPEIFFHLAATFERSVETLDFWEENFQHNIRLSHHLMTQLKESNSLRKVVFASSYLIYDPEQYFSPEPARHAVRLDEGSAIQPRNICGVAKLLHEIELRFLTDFPEIGFEAACARIFRSYGKHSRDVISRWVRGLLAGEELRVFKEEGIFDYIYADDVAEGLIRMSAPGIGGIINLGTDNGRRVREVVEILQQHFPELRQTREESDISFEASQANAERCRTRLGWSPGRQLEDVIPELIEAERHPSSQAANYTPIRVLVTSISGKVPLVRELRRALEKFGPSCRILGADLNANCLGRHFVDDFWAMPPLRRLTPEVLASVCHDRGIDAIVPTRDAELPYYARWREALAASGVHVMVSPSEAIDRCVDKLHFARALADKGFPAIPTSEALADIATDHYVVKERFGAGSAQLALDVSREQALAHGAGLDSAIFQPFISGREYSIDVYVARNGKVKGAVARSRDLVTNGESQITTTCRHEALETLCSHAAVNLGCLGHLVFQALEDEDGQLHLIECNARFGGASSLALAAGLDSFYWFALESRGASLDTVPFFRARGELRQIRHADDLVVQA